MRPWSRKLLLTVHLVLSIGWIGAVLAYLALDIVVASGDPQQARSAYLALAVVGGSVIVPLAIASLLTGIVLAAVTPWGLMRHYWVVISLVLTVFAVVLLLEHMPGVAAVAHDLQRAEPSAMHGSIRPDFEHAVGGLVVLLVVTALNVYKPRGLTPYGWRHRLDR